VFNSKRRGVLAAAALAVAVFGSAQAAQAGAGVPQVRADGPQADIIAILKTNDGAAAARKAGGDQQEYLAVRKAGGDKQQ
jgi:hypothetical protein